MLQLPYRLLNVMGSNETTSYLFTGVVGSHQLYQTLTDFAKQSIRVCLNVYTLWKSIQLQVSPVISSRTFVWS